MKAPYRPGDILYVRETWAEVETVDGVPFYIYKADHSAIYADADHGFKKWHPSIHMPKKAARIWLKVTDVRVERLQDISKDTLGPNNQVVKEGFRYDTDFAASWNSTIKKSDINKYGWYANPWVWVIEFEQWEGARNE